MIREGRQLQKVLREVGCGLTLQQHTGDPAGPKTVQHMKSWITGHGDTAAVEEAIPRGHQEGVVVPRNNDALTAEAVRFAVDVGSPAPESMSFLATVD